jgi:hypothetical protein
VGFPRLTVVTIILHNPEDFKPGRKRGSFDNHAHPPEMAHNPLTILH